MYGKEIKKAREINGASQLQVAVATKMPQSTISWIELDKGIPNIQQCVQLAQFYEISVDDLIGLSDYKISDEKSLSQQTNKPLSNFDKEFKEILNDSYFMQTAKIFKSIKPELRALTLGYIIGILQKNGINTDKILGY